MLKKGFVIIIIGMFISTGIISTGCAGILKSKVNNIKNNVLDNNSFKTVICSVNAGSGEETIIVNLSIEDIDILSTTINRTQQAVITIHSKESSHQEIESAIEILNSSYITLNNYKLLPDDFSHQDFLNLGKGEINKEIYEKNIIFQRISKFFKNNNCRFSSIFDPFGFCFGVGKGDDVGVASFWNFFGLLPLVLKIAGYPLSYLTFAQLFYNLGNLLMGPISFQNGVHELNMFSATHSKISGIYSKSFFFMSMFNLVITIPKEYTDTFPFYSGTWFQLGFTMIISAQ